MTAAAEANVAPEANVADLLDNLTEALGEVERYDRNAPARKDSATRLAAYTRTLLTELGLRIYDAEPDAGDASEMVIVNLLGVNVLVRRRTADTKTGVETYVHVETDELADEHRPLVVEVDNNGGNTYGDG